ncbi:MAG: 7-cyano-7-deazaguanine synthase QueC [Gammaproteobacteria bacterium]|nr:7-cyano-7-deazaguanine synthase QueC [Gammaproteobacteria bacterium]
MKNTSPKKAVILLSGGLDSATALACAKSEGYDCYALSFEYGQRSMAELKAAQEVAEFFSVVEHRTLHLDLGALGGSALTDTSIEVPTSPTEGIPVTYVPARNTIFLSFAMAWAEVLDARDIFIGVNAVDYSGYPDCRPDFIKAFEQMANLATRAGAEGHAIHIHTPLIDLSKADIIRLGVDKGVDYGLTVSCYAADEQGRACGQCDSCRLRIKGFDESGIKDPTSYQL